MIVKGLTGRLAKHLIEDSHPTVDASRCINRIQQKIPCRICAASCHVAALEDPENPDFGQCDDCGICVAHCPGRAITGSRLYVGRLLELTQRAVSRIVLGCQYAQGEADCKRACLAAYPWEVMAALILGGSGLSFLHGNCESCIHHPQMSLFRRSLERLRSFLGEEKYLAALEKDVSVQLQTRREAFTGLLRRGQNSAAVILPEELRQDPDSDLWRKLLVHRLCFGTQAGEEEKNNRGSWTAPMISDTCRACGICTKVCPNKALHVAATEDGRFYMVHFGWKCGGCGLCASACPWGSIDGFGMVSMKEADRPMTTLTRARPCTGCGEPCVEGDLCISCMLKARGN